MGPLAGGPGGRLPRLGGAGVEAVDVWVAGLVSVVEVVGWVVVPVAAERVVVVVAVVRGLVAVGVVRVLVPVEVVRVLVPVGVVRVLVPVGVVLVGVVWVEVGPVVVPVAVVVVSVGVVVVSVGVVSVDVVSVGDGSGTVVVATGVVVVTSWDVWPAACACAQTGASEASARLAISRAERRIGLRDRRWAPITTLYPSTHRRRCGSGPASSLFDGIARGRAPTGRPDQPGSA